MILWFDAEKWTIEAYLDFLDEKITQSDSKYKYEHFFMQRSTISFLKKHLKYY